MSPPMKRHHPLLLLGSPVGNKRTADTPYVEGVESSPSSASAPEEKTAMLQSVASIGIPV